MSEAIRIAEQIHAEWPYISVESARAFYESLGRTPTVEGEGTVRVSLWVLARVLEHEARHHTAPPSHPFEGLHLRTSRRQVGLAQVIRLWGYFDSHSSAAEESLFEAAFDACSHVVFDLTQLRIGRVYQPRLERALQGIGRAGGLIALVMPLHYQIEALELLTQKRDDVRIVPTVDAGLVFLGAI